MASLRRVKVLLVLNLIAVAGFVLFLAKCRPITTKSGDSFHDIHPRAEVANLTAHGISSIQDAVLKRLSLLEDIVYRQLNGLSKSLGLIEGYGGRGKGGLPATLSPEEEEKAKGPHEKYGYNSYLSEKISLDRSIPDYRPTKYVPAAPGGNVCVQVSPQSQQCCWLSQLGLVLLALPSLFTGPCSVMRSWGGWAGMSSWNHSIIEAESNHSPALPRPP
uniref:Polypeptide N-acetylgalactosaminyltransferase 17 n=1 Tax=Ficedula albicollis TaxID=59894 RepID=A0A803W711_FICAL